MSTLQYSFLFLLFSLPSYSQTTVPIRICTYNVLNFSSMNTDTARQRALKRVLTEIRPDILVLNEIADGTKGLIRFHLNCLPFSDYDILEAPDGYDTENALLVNHYTIKTIQQDSISTSLRRIDHWTFVVKASNDTIHLFGCHLKAGDDQDAKMQRGMEVAGLRLALDGLDGKNVILAGDLNAYNSSDLGYGPLVHPAIVVDPENNTKLDTLHGELVDVMEAGNWHDNADFSYLHSQSPASRHSAMESVVDSMTGSTSY